MQHTIDCNDPDLEAFKCNLHAIIRAWQTGKNAALVPVSNILPNTQNLSWSRNRTTNQTGIS